ncbi:hypothetical protein C8J56DRAFT_798531, partial [Mycena floridula]
SVLITSRDILIIAVEFTNEACIDVRAHDADVLSYITYRIEQEKRLKMIVKEDAVLKKEILTQMTEKAAGMFLLVQLHLDSLASKNNCQALRQALGALLKDIHCSYDETMMRILAQGEDDANLACQVFLWLTYAKKRLTVEQLQHALVISPGMTESVRLCSVDAAGLDFTRPMDGHFTHIFHSALVGLSSGSAFLVSLISQFVLNSPVECFSSSASILSLASPVD